MDNSIPNNSCSRRTIILVALLLSLTSPGTINSIRTCLGSHALSNPEFRPAAEPPILEQLLLLPWDGAGKQRRRLRPFQLCLACKCCAAAVPTPVCATMPCCFGIDCQLPNKPFGVCAFVPRSCNCASCAV